MRMIASVGSTIASAITPFERRGLCVLVVVDLPAPVDDVALLVGLLDRDVGHEPSRGGAVRVVLARLEEDAVAGADDLDRPALTLAEADALGDPDRLAARVRVPGGARAGREVHGGGADLRRLARRRNGVEVNGAGEPLARAVTGF